MSTRAAAEPDAARDLQDVRHAPAMAPRTLADQLRGWSDQQLAALLDARADLATPAPQDSAQLASRASTRASVLRVLDRLDTLELTVLDAMVSLGGRSSLARAVEVVHASPDRVAAAVAHLRALAMLWGEDDDLRVVSAVVETLGTTVSRLGPPLEQLVTGYGPDRLASLMADLGERSSGDRAADVRRMAAVLGAPQRVHELLADCDPAAQAMVRHLDSTGATGATETAPVSIADAVTPVEQLVARGLLLPVDRRHVAVPREVGLALRGGRTTHEPVEGPPPLLSAPRSARLVDSAAAGAAHELVHRVELLLDDLGEHPLGVLRQGGLAKRDLKAVAALLGVQERSAALHVEVATAAGLIGQGSVTGVETVWLPTEGYDGWRAARSAARWAKLAAAWLASPRLFGLVGGRLNDKPVNALAPELERAWVAETRRAALAQVADLDPGCALASGTGVPSLVARVEWLRPRRPAGRADAVASVVEEAALLGVVGLGSMSRQGRALLADGAGAAAEAVEPLLPRPVDHVLLQADLTAVAPGPLEDALARDLAVVARVESRGGATVYRFTAASVRHAFDVGWSSVEVHEAIARAARTEVPQPLRYLIEDVARTFGRIRVGSAEAFLRSDDEAALTALVHDSKAASLKLRRIAPTVVVSGTPIDVLLPRLRELGASPVVEGPDGVVRVARPEPARARATMAGSVEGAASVQAADTSARQAARASATVAAIRAGDRGALVRPAPLAARQSPAASLALLREATEGSSTVWIGYVDQDGSTQDRLVDPHRVDGGWLRAVDHRSGELRSFAVHRISSVRPVTESSTC